MRKDPINGVIWITFDGHINKAEVSLHPAFQWLNLPRMGEVKSFPSEVHFELTPNVLLYYGISLSSSAIFFLTCYSIAHFAYSNPKPFTIVVPAKPTPIQSKPITPPVQIVVPSNSAISKPATSQNHSANRITLPDVPVNTVSTPSTASGDDVSSIPPPSTKTNEALEKNSKVIIEEPITITIPQEPIKEEEKSNKTPTSAPSTQKRKIQRTH